MFKKGDKTKKMYQASDIKVGQVLLCVDDGDYDFWTEGKRYEVVADELGKPCIYSDSSYYPMSHRDAIDIVIYLNNEPNNYEVVMQLMEDEQEEKKMFKEEDIYAGMKLECVSNGGFTHWTESKVYVVDDNFQIYSDITSPRNTQSILEYLNEVDNGSVRFKVVEKKGYTLDDLNEGMVLRCIDDRGYGFWTTGKEYPVYKDENGVYIVDEEGSKSRNRNLLNRLNDKGSNARMEIVSTPESTEPEEITLTITGSNYQELLDQACELKRLLNVHVTNSNTAQEALQTITETFGGAK